MCVLHLIYSYYRHYRLYSYIFTDRKILQLTQTSMGKTSAPPVWGTLMEAMEILPIPEPTEDVEEEGVEDAEEAKE